MVLKAWPRRLPHTGAGAGAAPTGPQPSAMSRLNQRAPELGLVVAPGPGANSTCDNKRFN